MALYHLTTGSFSRGSRNTVRAIAYRAGCKLYDQATGQTFNYQNKDVGHVELLVPHDAPLWIKDIQALIKSDLNVCVLALVDKVEAAEKRIDARVWREVEFALHRELAREQNVELAREFVQDQLCARGMVAQLNFEWHKDEKTGEEKPHCHVVLTTRRLEEGGFSAHKEREWNSKELLCDLRVQWQEYSNFHLKMHGHEVRIDHRSYKDQGLDIEPQLKRGRNILEMEKRLQKLEGAEESEGIERGGEFERDGLGPCPLTERGWQFHQVQLRNLYRIVRQPELLFEIVTRNHTTFTWAEVQKKLHQYVDNPQLFERLDLRLRNSSELLMLRPESEDTPAIYTTHRLLEVEKSLVASAEGLSSKVSHNVSTEALEGCLHRTRGDMAEKGYRLSADQEAAIRHMVDGGQLKCVVGYAGAGKTTAIQTCREIWEESGYKVYGLAPTGRAANNLEESGIRSQTLHRFLNSYEEGRCQYNPRSVLVLDEGGMVDGGRFKGLLEAVNDLGVKLIVVGDGAQLQPLEACPAFRLITERVGAAYLKEVVRQNEPWQREATVLFGKQETREALLAYKTHGNIHRVPEKVYDGNAPQDVVKCYEVAARTSGLIYREMLKDLKTDTLSYTQLKDHQDYRQFKGLRGIQQDAAREILGNPKVYKPYLEVRHLDPTEMARLLGDRSQSKEAQYQAAHSLLKEKGLSHLIGIQRPTGMLVETRNETKKHLIEDWKKEYQNNPNQTLAILAHSNQGVQDLNAKARSYLKAQGHISTNEFTYTIKREETDDFGRKTTLEDTRAFSKGDRIVFTRNRRDLGVTNGSLGTITDLGKNSIEVKLDKGDTLTFAPTLNPHFDQGWAITIHKSQGITVDKSFVLLSHEMNQNLTYVAMTRHREDVKAYGSTLDFWRPEKVMDILAKSGDKLSAGDYLDSKSLEDLMKEEDKFLEKLLNRLSDEVQAMKTVAIEVTTRLADHFLGRDQKDKTIHIPQEILREEQRAEQLLKINDLAKSKGTELPRITDVISTVKVREKTRSLSPSETETLKPIPKRLLEIRNELIQDKRDEGSKFPQSYALVAHMKAERLYTIEQLIARDHKREHGVKLDACLLPTLAQMEFERNENEREKLTDKLQKDHGLNQRTATLCALEMTRYKEKHDTYLTDHQKSQFVALAKSLVTWGNDLKREGFNSSQIAFLQKEMSERMQKTLGKETFSLDNKTKDLALNTKTLTSLQDLSIIKMKTLESTLHQQEKSLQRHMERESESKVIQEVVMR